MLNPLIPSHLQGWEPGPCTADLCPNLTHFVPGPGVLPRVLLLAGRAQARGEANGTAAVLHAVGPFRSGEDRPFGVGGLYWPGSGGHHVPGCISLPQWHSRSCNPMLHTDSSNPAFGHPPKNHSDFPGAEPRNLTAFPLFLLGR